MTDVAAGVIFRNGRVLLCRRPPDKPPCGWEFPGGKREEKESFADCLQRELKEELGIDVFALDVMGEAESVSADGSRRIRLKFIRGMMRPGSPEPRPLESQHCEWVELSRLGAIDFLPADRKFADFLKKLS